MGHLRGAGVLYRWHWCVVKSGRNITTYAELYRLADLAKKVGEDTHPPLIRRSRKGMPQAVECE